MDSWNGNEILLLQWGFPILDKSSSQLYIFYLYKAISNERKDRLEKKNLTSSNGWETRSNLLLKIDPLPIRLAILQTGPIGY